MIELEPQPAGEERDAELVERYALPLRLGRELGMKIDGESQEELSGSFHAADSIASGIDTVSTACDTRHMSTTGKIQIEFITFPGIEPWTVERGWPHLSAPCKVMSASTETDEIGDAVMEMVDWAIDGHPDVFDLSSDDYEQYNDLSVSLAGELALTVENVVDGKDCVKSEGGIWADWYRDFVMGDGVTVRVARFAR